MMCFRVFWLVGSRKLNGSSRIIISGDVMSVAFANGWIADGEAADGVHGDNDRVLIYYASSDTRMHVAESTVGRLADYCMNTPQDGLFTAASVETIKALVAKNRAL